MADRSATDIWPRRFTDSDHFERELEWLDQSWQLLGPVSDLAQDGDWVTSSIAGRSVFVQRFRDRIAGFENICPHRFFPLRNQPRGQGPIRCGFHGWSFNRHGAAIGIPQCEEMFGRPPQDMQARLRPVDTASCGDLLFGRLPSASSAETNSGAADLASFLGPLRLPVEAALHGMTPIEGFELETAANWKLCYHLTLDDYHLVTIHPDTFGANGPLPPDIWRYFLRFDPHSAMLIDGEAVPEQAYETLLAGCRNGRYDRGGYKIFQIFPSTVFLSFRHEDTDYVVATAYQPVAVARTLVKFWIWRDATYRNRLNRPTASGAC